MGAAEVLRRIRTYEQAFGKRWARAPAGRDGRARQEVFRLILFVAPEQLVTPDARNGTLGKVGFEPLHAARERVS